MLELKNVSLGYGKTILASGLDFTAVPGELHILVGPNGCGKSTLLKTLCGLLPPAAGEVLADGEKLSSLSSVQRARRVSCLAQQHVLPEIPVGRLVISGRYPYLGWPHRYGPAEERAAAAAMERLGIAELKDCLLTRLSGGQQQNAYLAMLLAQDTPYMLLDEPTTYLDEPHQLRLLRLLTELTREGKGIVLVMHDLSLAFRFADRITVMCGGRLTESGSPEAVLASAAVDRAFGARFRRLTEGDRSCWYFEEEPGK